MVNDNEGKINCLLISNIIHQRINAKNTLEFDFLANLATYFNDDVSINEKSVSTNLILQFERLFSSHIIFIIVILINQYYYLVFVHIFKNIRIVNYSIQT